MYLTTYVNEYGDNFQIVTEHKILVDTVYCFETRNGLQWFTAIACEELDEKGVI